MASPVAVEHEARALTEWPTDALMRAAASRRDLLFGLRVTYSPKVFIPLTTLCRDRCGYCTFAQSPATASSPYLSLEQVLAVAGAGSAAGCHEALFTLGEAPELRYPLAAEWLAAHGHRSTVDYLAAAAALVLSETGLLPHANAGALTTADLHVLRRTCASQGMMLESVRDDLVAHRGAPDKHPSRRLATLEAAGALRIPFTTGLLVGIGDTEQDRVTGLLAIAEAHRRHGHVQEVIVQNFVPKPRTAMRRAAPCGSEEHLRTIALARLILPDDVHVQAPPNLSEPAQLADLVAAGIDDWGGVSPVTADHVNPERQWPSVEALREATEGTGRALVPRLTVYPAFAASPETWLDEALRFPVLDRSDAERLARDDPGQVWPERYEAAANVGTGAEVLQVGRRSTAWYSGSGTDPVPLRQGGRPTGAVREVLDGVAAGQRTEAEQLLTLMTARGADVRAVAELADELRRRAVGDDVTFVVNRNINYTNVCTFKCTFCGFSKGPLSLNLRGTPYLLTPEQVADRSAEAAAAGATEVCLQGGIHPSFDGDFYVEVVRAVHERVPGLHIHGLTALEVKEGAERSGESLTGYLLRLKHAGLRSLPGTAAEILDDSIRSVLCPDKLVTEEWLEVHRTAHGLGLRSNVTMMFGSIEQPEHWVRHLLVTRALQEQTGGFTEFVGLPFVHMAAPVYLKRRARRGPTWRETVLVHAVARIAYAGLIDHVQASWVKVGSTGVAQLLDVGVDDLGGTLMDENISRAAGAAHGQAMSRSDLEGIAHSVGRPLRQRTTLYEAFQS
ncbi:MAG: 5-amino-6-(D-ribitylamino)uracil--L-tyrosine 4-hydroxyphenyl transferase CofH [Actinomycetes bacterium]